MGENSAIEWTDHTFNPWEGCQKVGPGCDHCYAETRNKRFAGGANWGPGAPRRRTSASNWAQPRIWQRKAKAFKAEHGHWPRVFCASLADVFDNAVPEAWRRDLWELIRETPDLRWILLTKRVGNIARMLPFGWLDGDFDHVGLMITVVDQAEADRDVLKLFNVPIAGRQWFGASHEPALGGIDWRRIAEDSTGANDALAGLSFCQGRNEPAPSARLSWIIYGGESGPDARPHHPDWARADRDQCAAAGVAFMMKQWGEFAPVADEQLPARFTDPACADFRVVSSCGFVGDLSIGSALAHKPAHFPQCFPDGDAEDSEAICNTQIMRRVGKARAGRLLDGREHLQFPGALT